MVVRVGWCRTIAAERSFTTGADIASTRLKPRKGASSRDEGGAAGAESERAFDEGAKDRLETESGSELTSRSLTFVLEELRSLRLRSRRREEVRKIVFRDKIPQRAELR